MKINKLVSVLGLALSQASFAEMTMIEDEELSSVTGQKGLTIDIDMGIEIGEFMYQDAGSVVIQGMRLGGRDRSDEVGTLFDGSVGLVEDITDRPVNYTGFAGGTTGLNNVRILVDVAGDGTDLTNNGILGANPFDPSQVFYKADNQFMWAWGDQLAGGGTGSTGCGLNSYCAFVAGDGDLFIHATATDAGNTEDGRPFTIADFGMEIDAFKLKESSYIAGDDIVDRSGTANAGDSTTIFSELKMEGYFGGFDLLLENKGNSFGTYDEAGAYTATGYGDAASKIKINSFFEITEMEYTFDIVGIRYEKMAVHNRRGDQSMFDFLSQDDIVIAGTAPTSLSYAQSNVQIYAVKDNVLQVGETGGANGRANFVDGISMDSRFQGDMDIAHLSFGDTGTSIGSLYYTDIDVLTYRTISAH